MTHDGPLDAGLRDTGQGGGTLSDAMAAVDAAEQRQADEEFLVMRAKPDLVGEGGGLLVVTDRNLRNAVVHLVQAQNQFEDLCIELGLIETDQPEYAELPIETGVGMVYRIEAKAACLHELAAHIEGYAGKLLRLIAK